MLLIDRLIGWRCLGGGILWCRCLYHTAGTPSAADRKVGIGPVYGSISSARVLHLLDASFNHEIRFQVTNQGITYTLCWLLRREF